MTLSKLADHLTRQVRTGRISRKQAIQKLANSQYRKQLRPGQAAQLIRR